MNNEAVVIVAGRKDGIGERLRAIMNCIILSDAIGGQFLFHWPDLDRNLDAQFVDMLPVDRMFSAAFIEKHHIDPARLRSLSAVPLSPDLNEIAGLGENSGPCAFLAPAADKLVPGSSIGRFSIPEDCYVRAFNSIEFSDEIQAAVNAARLADVPASSIALHIRSGDLVYGNYRYFGTLESKLIPLEISEYLIAKNPETKFVIFCQDKDIISRVRGHDNVIVPEDVADTAAFNGVQSVLFEISLMSRCGKIIAGSSAFASLAAQVSAKSVDAIGAHLTPRECIEVALKSAASAGEEPGVSPQQKAMTAWWTIVMFGRKLAPADELTLVRFARRMDPINPQYWLHESGILISNDDLEGVEELLFSALAENPAARQVFMKHIAMMRRPSAVKRSTRHLDRFAVAAAKGGRMASFVYAILAKQFGRTEDAALYTKRFKALSMLSVDAYAPLAACI